jgi:hypothetical protein
MDVLGSIGLHRAPRRLASLRSAACSLLVLLAAAVAMAGTEGGPEVTDPLEPAKLLGILPWREPLRWISGVTFFKGRAYVATNKGLIAVTGDKADALYRWPDGENSIYRVWNDVANDALWAWRDHAFKFARYDGARWEQVEPPYPPRGYYTRRDDLEGFIGISLPQGFWLGGGDSVWHRTDGTWAIEPTPPSSRWSVRAVAPVGDSFLYLVQDGIFGEKVPFTIYDRNHDWRATPLDKIQLETVAVASDAIYALDRDGSLFVAKPGASSTVAIPGPCEAIARTSDGALLAAFSRLGIYVRVRDEWKRIAPYPRDSTEGRHGAYLAEDHGRIAFATSSDDGEINAFWLLAGDQLKRVTLE